MAKVNENELSLMIDKYLEQDIPLALLVESYDLSLEEINKIIRRLYRFKDKIDFINEATTNMYTDTFLENKKVLRNNPNYEETNILLERLEELKTLISSSQTNKERLNKLRNELSYYNQEEMNSLESLITELSTYNSITEEVLSSLLKKHNLTHLNYSSINSIYSSYTSLREEILQLEKEAIKLIKYRQEYEEIRQILIIHNISLVNLAIRRFFSNIKFDQEDAQALGLEGLTKALDSYKTNKSQTFQSYALTQIIANIKEHFKELTSFTWEEYLRKEEIAYYREKAKSITGRKPTTEELSKNNELSLTELEINESDELIDEVIPVSSLSIPEVTESGLIKENDDFIKYLEATSPESIEDIMDSLALKEILNKTLDTLNERERKVITSRYGIDCEQKTLDEIAIEMGETREIIRNLEARALKNLRHPKRYVPLKPYADLIPHKVTQENHISADRIYSKLLYLLNANVSTNGVLVFMRMEGVEWNEKELVKHIGFLNTLIASIIDKYNKEKTITAIIREVKEAFNIELSDKFIEQVIKIHNNINNLEEKQTKKM